jgi:RHS repeat-associated protein
VTVGERDSNNILTIKGNDYRVLQPALVMDPNRNRTKVAFDILGMVAGTAVLGKPLPAPVEGDSLDGFVADVTQAQLDQFMNAPRELDPITNECKATQIVYELLNKATTRIVYDLDRFKRLGEPTFAATIARETHVSDLQPNQKSKLQVSFSYSDGFGREIQKKIQAEKGKVPQRDGQGKIIVGPDNQPVMSANEQLRWVGSGWTIFNNKGKPVRKYEPFFSDTHKPDFDAKIGVSPILFYDPLERIVATLHPNHTYEKIIFGPWQQTTWDVNDTVALDPRLDVDIKGHTEGYFKMQPVDWKTWLQQRAVDPANPPADTQALPPEKRAAVRTFPHTGTPSVAHFDTLGRTFLTIADNGKDSNAHPQKYRTRVEFDIEGNQRAMIDAKERAVMRYDYDLLGNRIHQNSMDAGERWMLNDVTGKPIRAWDTPPKDSHPGNTFRTEYDELRRPVRSFVKGSIENDPGREILYEHVVYGEKHPRAETLNLRTRVFLQFDGAGIVSNGNVVVPPDGREEAYDFKGNLLRSSRRLAKDYKNTPDWKSLEPLFRPATLDLTAIENGLTPLLEAEFFEGSTRFDALNRPIQIFAPHSNLPDKKRNVIRPGYNEANLLERMDVWLERDDEPEALLDRATAEARTGVSNIDYNAKGQRQQIEYKNGVSTNYTYEKETFRLIHLETLRVAERLQGLQYSYDPVGNITSIRDDAQQTLIFGNQLVEPHNDYTYDAIYRLIKATGREHLGQTANPPTPYDEFDFFHIRRNPNDPNVMGRYVEEYSYDQVGNILFVRHRGADPQHPGWKRCYQYAENSNRLLSTSNPKTAHYPDVVCSPHYAAAPVLSEKYGYDTHGNMTSMPHLSAMGWDFRDQLRNINLDGGGKAFYVYNASGQRTRKVWEKNGQVDERIYLGGFEVFRGRNGIGGAVMLVRETLHIMDDKQRIALVETRTDKQPQEQLIRYQYSNHLGSASLELDDQGQIVSYEEYAPYGSSTYQAVRSQTETAKRYRYTGMERDEESGLSYHGARYYLTWLGRWSSVDPVLLTQPVRTLNGYFYGDNQPVNASDPSGRDIVVRPESKLTAKKIVELIQKSEELPPAVRQAFSVKPPAKGQKESNVIVVSQRPRLGPGETLPAWFTSIQRASVQNEWEITTGVTQKVVHGSFLIADIRAEDHPGYPDQTGTRWVPDDILDPRRDVVGTTIPSYKWKFDLAADDRAKMPGYRNVQTHSDKGVIVVSLEITVRGSTYKLSTSRLAHTVIHELALHAGRMSGQIPQDKVGGKEQVRMPAAEDDPLVADWNLDIERLFEESLTFEESPTLDRGAPATPDAGQPAPAPRPKVNKPKPIPAPPLR